MSVLEVTTHEMIIIDPLIGPNMRSCDSKIPEAPEQSQVVIISKTLSTTLMSVSPCLQYLRSEISGILIMQLCTTHASSAWLLNPKCSRYIPQLKFRNGIGRPNPQQRRRIMQSTYDLMKSIQQNGSRRGPFSRHFQTMKQMVSPNGRPISCRLLCFSSPV